MDYEAVALLKIPDCDREDLDLQLLDDGVLLFTGEPFETATDELMATIAEQLGELLSQHVDPRGVFVFPDACDPRSRSYEAVVNEIGELGVWVQPDELGALDMEDAPEHADLLLLPETFQGLVENMVHQISQELGGRLPPRSDSDPDGGTGRA